MGTSIEARHVLICEDDPAMVRILQFILRQQGVGKISTTARGETVLDMVQRHKPDLLLLDMMLPGKDGLTVLKELKANSATLSLPVIVVSGREAQEQIRQAMTAGAVDYVIKPFEPMELGKRIRSFLENLNVKTVTPPSETKAGGPR